jgi:hypothetical protein
MKAFLVFLAVVGMGIAVIVGSYITNYNYGNRAEVGIVTAYENVQNVYSSYTNKVMEAAQINEMYREDVKDVITSALDARYGEEGVQSAFAWIQEQNPGLDASVYVKLQQIIQAGREEFQHEQTRLLDLRRVYKTNLGYLWKGLWLRIAGYPKIDLDKYEIIVSNATTEAFETGEDKPLDIRK